MPIGSVQREVQEGASLEKLMLVGIMGRGGNKNRRTKCSRSFSGSYCDYLLIWFLW